MADSYSLKAILSAVDGISPVLKNVQGAAKNARKYLGDVGGSISSLASKIGVPTALVAGLGTALGAVAIKKYVTDFAAYSEQVMKSALVMGATTDEAQRMAYVFEQAGAPVEAAQKSMGKLNQNIAAAASGKNQDLEQLFKRLGIPLRGVNGQLRSATDMLPQLADAFVKNKNPAVQAAMGTALFSKTYQEMLPFLNEGSAGIIASTERFNKLADVMGAKDLAGGKAFGDQLQDLGFIAQNLQRIIGRELVPVLGPLIERFIQWFAANKDLISSEISKTVRALVASLQGVDWAGFIKGVRDTVSWLARMVDSVGGAKNALIALFLIMNVQSIVAIVGLIASLGRLSIALGGITLQAAAAATSMGFFAASGASVTTALTTSLAGAAKSAGLLGAAALVGYAFGSVIYKCIEDMPIADWIGEKLARVAAFFGSEDARRALDTNAAAARTMSTPSAPAARPGALGSGSFNLNAPPVASLTGKVDINFQNAPPGMAVTQARADGTRVAMNTNVGYRSLGATGAF